MKKKNKKTKQKKVIKKTKPKKTSRILEIPLEIYNHTLAVFIESTPKEIGAFLDKKCGCGKKHHEKELETWKWGNGMAWMNGQPCIWLRNTPKDPESISVLAHEALHAASFLCDKVGVKFDSDKSEETYAYLISYITAKVLERTMK